MRSTRTDIMGMPITIEVVESDAAESIAAAFALFEEVDREFSTYKEESELSRIRRGEVAEENYSPEMQEVLAQAERTKKETDGYFDARRPDGSLDPTGIVKGWAIQRAAELLTLGGHQDFMIDAAGDIATYGKNSEGKDWSVGIRNPFAYEEIVKVVYPRGKGIATSGTAARGAHIYNPHAPTEALTDMVSVTVIGPTVLEADRFATAAFAMQHAGIEFLERTPGLEGYAIDEHGLATMTSGFPAYTL